MGGRDRQKTRAYNTQKRRRETPVEIECEREERHRRETESV